MAKERLSKLQKEVLLSLYEYGEIRDYDIIKNRRAHYNEILTSIAGKFNKTYHYRDYPMDASFRSVFSQSVRNMEKKGLIKLGYGGLHGKMYRRKICEGKHPESGKPCKDCPYLKKYGIQPQQRYYDESPYEQTFFVDYDRCIFYKQRYGHSRKVSEIILLDKGKQLVAEKPK